MTVQAPQVAFAFANARVGFRVAFLRALARQQALARAELRRRHLAAAREALGRYLSPDDFLKRRRLADVVRALFARCAPRARGSRTARRPAHRRAQPVRRGPPSREADDELDAAELLAAAVGAER